MWELWLQGTKQHIKDKDLEKKYWTSSIRESLISLIGPFNTDKGKMKNLTQINHSFLQTHWIKNKWINAYYFKKHYPVVSFLNTVWCMQKPYLLTQWLCTAKKKDQALFQNAYIKFYVLHINSTSNSNITTSTSVFSRQTRNKMDGFIADSYIIEHMNYSFLSSRIFNIAAHSSWAYFTAAEISSWTYKQEDHYQIFKSLV